MNYNLYLDADDLEISKVRDIVDQLARHSTKRYDLRAKTSIKRIVLHTTDWEIDPYKLARYDIGPNHISSTGCPAITYHYLIMPDGIVYRTLPIEEVSWHVGVWNPGSIGVALSYRVSGTSGDQYAPTYTHMRTGQIFLGKLCLQLGLEPLAIVGHRELKGTGWFWFKGSKRLRKTCPGMAINLDNVRQNVAKYMQLILQKKGYYPNKIDGIWGPASRSGLKAYKTIRI